MEDETGDVPVCGPLWRPLSGGVRGALVRFETPLEIRRQENRRGPTPFPGKRRAVLFLHWRHFDFALYFLPEEHVLLLRGKHQYHQNDARV